LFSMANFPREGSILARVFAPLGTINLRRRTGLRIRHFQP